jgi:hypothetical protein
MAPTSRMTAASFGKMLNAQGLLIARLEAERHSVPRVLRAPVVEETPREIPFGGAEPQPGEQGEASGRNYPNNLPITRAV